MALQVARWCFCSCLFYSWLTGVTSVMPQLCIAAAVQGWYRGTWGCNCERLALSSSVLYIFFSIIVLFSPQMYRRKRAFQEKCFLPITLCCGGMRGTNVRNSRYICANRFIVTEVGCLWFPPPLHYSISFQEPVFTRKQRDWVHQGCSPLHLLIPGTHLMQLSGYKPSRRQIITQVTK